MDHQLISLLELLPSLRVLLVEQDNFKDRKQLISEVFFERLAVSYRASITALFLPRLTDLTLTVPAKNLPHDALLQALSSRWLPQGVAHNSPQQTDCLQSFSLTVLGLKGDPEPDHFASLQHLRDAGLRVVTKHVIKG
ncbi:hypothetical protein MPER_09123 [Moniliophthora perniciosa FA553]|nr:hypothetical protein MPER_09123 [Moniliophthora perniciosa FA553]